MAARTAPCGRRRHDRMTTAWTAAWTTARRRRDGGPDAGKAARRAPVERNEQGVAAMALSDLLSRTKSSDGRAAAGILRGACESLPPIGDAEAFGAAFDRFGGAKVVLLGEATHGTSEFYRARAAITRRLVEKHGFTIVAVEADWPDAAAIDRYIRHRPHRPGREPPFQRFPTWMWRNTVVERLTHDLRALNQGRAPEAMAGFYGLDIYNMSGSIAAVLAYLDEHDPEAAAVARERYGCLTPWQAEPATYGRAALT